MGNITNSGWVTNNHIPADTKFKVDKHGDIQVAPKTSFLGGMTQLFRKTYSPAQLKKAPTHVAHAVKSAQGNKTPTIAHTSQEGNGILGQATRAGKEAQSVKAGEGNLAAGTMQKAMSDAYDARVRAVIDNPNEALKNYKRFQQDEQAVGAWVKSAPCDIRQGQGATAVGKPLNGPGKKTYFAAGEDKPNTIEVGNFKNDELHGLGKRTDMDGEEKGIFENSVLVSGTKTEGNLVREGTFHSNGELIKGTVTDTIKSIVRVVEEGKADGSFKGKITYPDGEVVNGEVNTKGSIVNGTSTKERLGGTLVKTVKNDERIPSQLILEGKTITLPPTDSPVKFYADEAGKPRGYYHGSTKEDKNGVEQAHGHGKFTYIAEDKPYATYTVQGIFKEGKLLPQIPLKTYYNAGGKEVREDGTPIP